MLKGLLNCGFIKNKTKNAKKLTIFNKYKKMIYEICCIFAPKL